MRRAGVGDAREARPRDSGGWANAAAVSRRASIARRGWWLVAGGWWLCHCIRLYQASRIVTSQPGGIVICQRAHQLQMKIIDHGFAGRYERLTESLSAFIDGVLQGGEAFRQTFVTASKTM